MNELGIGRDVVTVREEPFGLHIRGSSGLAPRARYVPDRERSLQLQTHFNNSRTPQK